MSFGGGFGGFGSNNNQSSGFGGFGANNNNSNSSGFGSNNSTGTSIFGSNNNNNSGNSMFGSNNSTSSPFGGGGFGSNNNNTTFGSKPFGSSTTGGGLFGGSSSANTFGGFGANNNNNTASAFGGGSTSAGSNLFSQNKTGFGSSTTGGGGLFGGGNTTGGFGASNNNTAGGFGSSTSGGFGANQTNTGTANTPFNAFTEKDGTSSTATQQYQTITFQQPYQNFSLEELRVADYNQGRRYGNQNGQAGAFGQTTGFGGFGASNNNSGPSFGSNTNSGGGLFGGGNTNTTSTFGQGSNSAFGSNNNNASGGLFGQNKPATGGLFGGGSNTTNTTTGGGGLFGSTANTNTTGGFGSGGGFGSANTGSSLFGGNQNQQKPGGLFGNSTTTSNPFGSSTNTNTNAFGPSNTGGGLFGQNNQASTTSGFGTNSTTNNAGGGLFGASNNTFGQNNQNQTQNTTSGGLFGGFGQNNQQNQAKPGGLFGSTNNTTTGGGLFGQNNQSQQSGGLFGNNNTNNSTGGGLFGQKPATTGAGLFGGNNTNAGTTGGGLFGGLGNQNNQQSTGGSLFGTQNQAKPGGLFGTSTTATNTGGGLFGGLNQSTNNQPNLGGSLFSSQNNMHQQNQSAANSLFGASGSSLLNTSMNNNPYGNDALFSGLATPTQSPGPLATPLSSSQKNKKSTVLSQAKLNPSASLRLQTPQNKRTAGYGFTYSTYGTPASASSQVSPLSGSLFSNGSLSRGLSKSLSTSNLRNSFTPETSILSPGAFTSSTRHSGSLKKLTVNRSINSAFRLFDDPPPKRVSFAAASESANTNGTGNPQNALVVRRGDDNDSPRQTSNDTSGEETPRPAHTNGTELARVNEDSALTPKSSSSVNIVPGKDPRPGPYWSRPSLEQLKKMSRQELKSVPNFVVGRQHVGEIRFNHGEPVDLSDVDLDKIYGDIVQLNPRNATVYGPTCTCLPKPELGTALNRPSWVCLGNSWPRNKAGKKDVKHLERLKRVAGTNFQEYRTATGEWVFTVPHFSTYKLDYDEDYSDDDNEESSELSPPPDALTQSRNHTSQMDVSPQDKSFISPEQSQSSPDDTFDFKKGMRSKAFVPGDFGEDGIYEEDDSIQDEGDQSFLGDRSVGSLNRDEESEFESDEDQNMADSVSSPVQTTEQANANDADLTKGRFAPKSILKASQVFRPGNGTPGKGAVPVFDDDWANQLQRTISPKKQDRTTLRESQGNVLRDQNSDVPQLAKSVTTRPFTTAMDLMDSLFGENEKQRQSKRSGQGIELPYPKRPKTADDLCDLNHSDQAFHDCSKPRFSHDGTLVYGNKGHGNLENGAFVTAQEPIIGATKDIRFVSLQAFDDAIPGTLKVQKECTEIRIVDGAPAATLQTKIGPPDFFRFAKVVAINKPAGVYEQQAWELLSLLFDEADQQEGHKELHRKEKLSDFWKRLVFDDAQQHAREAASAEEQAIAQLSCHNVPEACHALLQGLDLRLATMIAQIGGDHVMRQNMVMQLEEWRRLDVLAEMADPHRALYELLSGNCAQCDGKQGGGRENRASTFNISSRFALDWRRAFGLRLWYGIMADENIELAVAQFNDAIRDGKEDVRPIPWFVQTGTNLGWDDPEPEQREDLLWGILKLYSSPKINDLAVNLEKVLAPQNTSGHPLNARLSFQLFQILKSRHDNKTGSPTQQVPLPTVRENEFDSRNSLLSSTASAVDKDSQSANPLTELGDQLTLTYATSLSTSAHWTDAIWVYTHLSSPALRAHHIRALLNQYAHTYRLTDNDSTYTTLTRSLVIPKQWLHAAAALHAKAQGDAQEQVTHLLLAGEIDAAHDVLCRHVGPNAVISRDYEPLRRLAPGFIPASSLRNALGRLYAADAELTLFPPRTEPIPGWAQGGEIYFDFLALQALVAQRPVSPGIVDEDVERKIAVLLGKMERALELAGRDRLVGCALEERVALVEVSGVVAGLLMQGLRDGEKNNKGKGLRNAAAALRLPLTEDRVLGLAVRVSAAYYRGVVAGAR